jgi:hypothetical protein
MINFPLLLRLFLSLTLLLYFFVSLYIQLTFTRTSRHCMEAFTPGSISVPLPTIKTDHHCTPTRIPSLH